MTKKNGHPNAGPNVVSNKLSSFNRRLGNLLDHQRGLLPPWSSHCNIRLRTLWLYPDHTLLCCLLSDWLYVGLCTRSRRRDNRVLPNVSSPNKSRNFASYQTDDPVTSARPMSCAATPKLYDSLTLSCEEKFSSSYTAVVTTTSVFVDSGNTGTRTVVFTPHFDAVNGFGLEYVPVKSQDSLRYPFWPHL